MKVYTRTGDKGKTSLFSGERISKSNDRVETYGEVDELNAFVGMIPASLPGEETIVLQEIEEIQRTLFIIGSWLATTPDSGYLDQLEPMKPSHVSGLEHAIDRMSEKLPELRAFILPGGSIAAAHAHVARTVCRRVERHLIRLVENDRNHPEMAEQLEIIQQYLNRLSDYFFILARYCNMRMKISDIEFAPSADDASGPA